MQLDLTTKNLEGFMKFLILISCLLIGSSAFACPGTDQFTLCPNDSVIDPNGHRGSIKAVLQNRTVAVAYPGYSKNYFWSPEKLAVTRGCSPSSVRHCVGATVIDTNGHEGRISGVFRNGKVNVDYSGYSKSYIWEVQDLAITEGCTRDNYCVGDTVINTNGWEGKVSGVFQNGKVTINYSGYSKSYTWETRDLAVTNECSDRSIIVN